MKKKEERLEKEIAEAMVIIFSYFGFSLLIQSQNRKLKEPLQKARETNDELKRQLANYEKDKRCLKNSQTRLAAQKEEMKELKWEHEVFILSFECQILKLLKLNSFSGTGATIPKVASRA